LNTEYIPLAIPIAVKIIVNTGCVWKILSRKIPMPSPTTIDRRKTNPKEDADKRL